MEITWVTLAYLCWRCLRFPYQKWAYVPQTKEDGEDHVEDRLKVSIWEHLPPWLTKDFKLAEVQGHFYLSHFKGKRWNSRVIAYPMGAGKLRGKTHSGIVYDEAAHQNAHSLKKFREKIVVLERQREDIDGAIDLLIEAGWLRQTPAPARSAPGRPPSPAFDTHPGIHPVNPVNRNCRD